MSALIAAIMEGACCGLDVIIGKLRRGFSDLSAFTHPKAYRRDYRNTVAPYLWSLLAAGLTLLSAAVFLDPFCFGISRY